MTERLRDAIDMLRGELKAWRDNPGFVLPLRVAAAEVCRVAEADQVSPIAFEWHDCSRNWPDQKCEWGCADLYAYTICGVTQWGVRGVHTDPVSLRHRWHGQEADLTIEEAKQRAEALAMEWFGEMAAMRGLRVVDDAEASKREALLARALDAIERQVRHGNLDGDEWYDLLSDGGRDV